jgi:hypothetical protein
MDYKENSTWPNETESYKPYLVFIICGIVLRDRIWIFKNQSSSLKANIVFTQILAIFGIIPFKAHRVLPQLRYAICTYNCTSCVKASEPESRLLSHQQRQTSNAQNRLRYKNGASQAEKHPAMI